MRADGAARLRSFATPFGESNPGSNPQSSGDKALGTEFTCPARWRFEFVRVLPATELKYAMNSRRRTIHCAGGSREFGQQAPVVLMPHRSVTGH